jgi:hypothetical protein
MESAASLGSRLAFRERGASPADGKGVHGKWS